jgi:hypothetical protein
MKEAPAGDGMRIRDSCLVEFGGRLSWRAPYDFGAARMILPAHYAGRVAR